MVIVFLKLSDKDAHMSRIFARSENVVVKRPAAKYIENFDDIRKIQDYLINQAIEFDLPVIENVNQLETVMAIISLILSRIKMVLEGKSEV